jgi:DNA topoisomerase-1
MILVVIESPSKIKTLEKILGPNYIFFATCGHLFECTKLEDIHFTTEGVPTTEGVSINFTIKTNQKKNIKRLKQLYQDVDDILLAGDFDIEGEAICWEVCKILKIKPNKSKRVIFKDLTEETIKSSIHNCVNINMDIVSKYKARVVIDLIIGFRITPYIRNELEEDHIISAGRCQTPCLKIIQDEYSKELREINSYTLHIYFDSIDFTTSIDLPDSFDIQEILDCNFLIKQDNVKNSIVKCPEPLNTSSILQLASKSYGFNPSQTMTLLQSLYENGFITYHRTESTMLSNEFLIKHNKIHDNQQTTFAHEAIRFTDKPYKGSKNSNEYKIYNIIHTITSQYLLGDGEDEITTFIATNEKITAKYEYIKVKKLGWRKSKNNDLQTFMKLFSVKDQWIENPTKVSIVPVKPHPVGLLPHNLISMLSELKIGRPSTYSSFIDKLYSKNLIVELTDDIYSNQGLSSISLKRGESISITQEQHIHHKKGCLKVTELGNELLSIADNLFNEDEVFNIGYCAALENQLQDVTVDNWMNICFDIKSKLDNIVLPVNVDIVKDKVSKYKVIKGRFGLYVKINGNILSLSCYGNRTPESITQEEIVNALNKSRINELPPGMELKNGKFGYYLTRDGKNVSLKGFFEDPLTCNVNKLINFFDLN